MKILIQHNFNSGLGDFLKNLTAYMDCLIPLKEKGYKITLYINLYKNCYVDKPFFKRLFSSETYQFFDDIIESSDVISNTKYNEYQYHRSSHEPQSPGIHQWDIFFDGKIENIDIKYIEASNAYNLHYYPTSLPTFSDEVIGRVNEFIKKYNEFNFFHVRTSDIIDSTPERYDKIINKIDTILNQSDVPFYLGTNNKYIYEKMRESNKMITYEFADYSKYNNDMNAFKNFGPINTDNDDILLNRLFDISAEMILSSYSNQIYMFKDYSWISNFLFYSICHRKDTIKLNEISL